MHGIRAAAQSDIEVEINGSDIDTLFTLASERAGWLRGYIGGDVPIRYSEASELYDLRVRVPVLYTWLTLGRLGGDSKEYSFR